MPKIVVSEKVEKLATPVEMLVDLVDTLKTKGVIADSDLSAATVNSIEKKRPQSAK